MRSHAPSTTFPSALVIGLLVAGSLLTIAPPQTHAQGLPVYDASAVTLLGVIASIEAENASTNALNLVENTLTELGTWAQHALDYLFYFKEYVLEPLAYYQSGKAAQGLTGGMLSFVSGGSNGTGQAQFIQNLPRHLQGVGDNTTNAFLRQLRANSNSPYAGVVASSLRTNYNNNSSLAGFFASQRNTLPKFSSDPTAFISGNWSKGGMSAWFALTTQSQNNPYMFHQKTRGQLGRLIASAQSSHQQQVSWGDGFISWCGEGEATEQAQKDCNISNNYCGAGDRAGVLDLEAAAPGAPCTKKDGTPGVIQTPGTTITKYLDKSLGLDADKLVNMGNAATQITELVSTLIETVQMTQTVIGGPQGGLAGVGSSEPGERSIIDDYTNPDTAYGGVNQCSINHTLAKNSPSNGQSVSDLAERYVESWSIIGAAAQGASDAVTQVYNRCTSNAQLLSPTSSDYVRLIALAAEASEALNKGGPDGILFVLNKAETAEEDANGAVEDALELREKLEAEGVGDPPVCEDYSDDVAALRNTPPTATDLAYAQREATSDSAAITEPSGSLVIVEEQGTLVGKMTLLQKNATQLLGSCNP